MADNITAYTAYKHSSTALAFALHYLHSVLPEKTTSLLDAMRSNSVYLMNWYKYLKSGSNCVRTHMNIHNTLVSSFTQRGIRRRVYGEADTDDECTSPDTIPMDNATMRTPRKVARTAATTTSDIANIACATDDDTDSIMTDASFKSTMITATTVADNLGLDHPNVVEHLMQYDFEFPDSRQSVCLQPDSAEAEAEAEAKEAEAEEAEALTQYHGQGQGQGQDQDQDQDHYQYHSPSFEFQVLAYQMHCCKNKS